MLRSFLSALPLVPSIFKSKKISEVISATILIEWVIRSGQKSSESRVRLRDDRHGYFLFVFAHSKNKKKSKRDKIDRKNLQRYSTNRQILRTSGISGPLLNVIQIRRATVVTYAIFWSCSKISENLFMERVFGWPESKWLEMFIRKPPKTGSIRG